MWNRLKKGQKLIMGILNATPDSFYEGSRVSKESVSTHVREMVSNGVDILDIGGYSTRPGAQDVSEQEETDRVCILIESLHQEFPTLPISIDTFRSEVANNAIAQGASVINDVSGGIMDEGIYKVAAKHKVPYILMHMRGHLNNMQDHCSYKDIIGEVKKELINRVELARKAGVEKIIIDPGFGFSKTLSQNYELLKNLETLKDLELPLLVGVSRKSMIYKFLECKPEEALNATTVINTFALLNGADILRVHDVKEVAEARLLINRMLG